MRQTTFGTAFRKACRMICLAAAAGALCATAGPAFGWWSLSRPDAGFDTHDWALVEANRLADIQGDGWLVMEAALPATDDPDQVFGDYVHHFYDVWGNQHGDAPDRIAELYREAVRLRATGETTAASVTVGLMSHYYSDICQPMHTRAPVSLLDRPTHMSYEKTVADYTDAPGKNRDWIVGDGTDYVGNVTEYAISTAYASHADCERLFARYRERGFDHGVQTIAEAGLNRAAGGLADMIASINAEAGVHRLATSAITGDAPFPETIPLGMPTRLAGRLSLTTRSASGGTLVLQTRNASGAWRDSAAITCEEGGRWSYSARPKRNTEYRVRFAGDTTHLHSASTGLSVRVRPAVTLRLAKGDPGRAGFAIASVSVRPSHPGRVVRLQKRTARGWKTIGRVRLDGGSQAVWRWRPPRAGVYRFRALLPAHTDHAGAYSRVLRVVARP